MEWLAQNWFWVLLFALFIAMHLFGHGGHCAHSSHGNYRGCHDHNDEQQSDKADHEHKHH